MTQKMNAYMKKDTHFWCVEVVGNVLTISHGQSRTIGETVKITFPSIALAHKEAYRHISQKIAEGYLGASPPTKKREKTRSLPSIFNGLKTLAFIPVTGETEPCSKTNTRLQSRFGGDALLLATEDWPRCGRCSEDMRVLLHLNLAQLPANKHGLPSEGIVQIFHCEDVNCETWKTFVDSKLCRLLTPESLYRSQVIKPHKAPYPTKFIISWRKAMDYPSNGEECVEKLKLTEEEEEKYDNSSKYDPIGNDKLFGWPAFIQDPQYPQCPICNKSQMNFLFQINSNENIPHMWGDAGRAKIFYCPTHPDMITFHWECS